MRRVLAALITVGLAAGPALARSEKTLGYPAKDCWSTVVRFMVVDEHLKVLEKDADAGYVTFEMKDDGKIFRGAMEVMTIVKDGRTNVRFVLQIEDRPDWQEIAMLMRLERKLRAELGSPTPGQLVKDAPKDDKKDTDKPKEAPKNDGGPPISNTP
ncbi:MAG TPA: hypothetical protein VGM90_20270 [Kofleriaceae bacterium]|jgi:hypothetical protein